MSSFRELLRVGTVVAPVTAATEAALQDGNRRTPEPMSDRQFLTEGAIALAMAITAAVLATVDNSGFDITLAAALILALAAIQRVEFYIGSGFTVPTQLIFVPMLFLLPAGVVPSCVAIAMVIDRLPDFWSGKRHVDRAVMSVSDAWFSVGPAVVFALADPGGPSLEDWPIYLAALGAQFAFDFGASAFRDTVGLGATPLSHLAEMRTVWVVDTLLAPIGVLAAFACASQGDYAFLLVVPLAVLLRVFAQERQARLDQALELSSTYRRIALLLGDVIGEDDEYTGSHSQGVVSLAVAVADELRVGPDDRQLVEFGALLHDVGKIAIPNEIINKAGPLTPQEWQVMRTHTVEGQRMLDRVGGSLKEVGIVVRASHERWDGGGYPDGLAGEAIPLAARIVCAADAFSAMTTDRAYRSARSREAAIAELRDCAGAQFDPLVAEATIAIIERYGLPRRTAPSLVDSGDTVVAS